MDRAGWNRDKDWNATDRTADLMSFRFRIVTEPLDRWPLPDTPNRKSPQFKAKYDDTLALLNTELEFLGAEGIVVLQVVTHNGADDLRRDGALRQHARIEHPGVQLSFESMHGPLTYSTDRYETIWGSTPSWQHNLRAIALGLQALRAVDRYGITRTGEQYRGWQQLADKPHELSREQAIGVLRAHSNIADPAAAPEALYRRAARLAHPDRNGGMRGAWDDVDRAARALGLNIGRAHDNDE